MSTLQSEVFEALRAIDIPEDKALKAAAALARRDIDVAELRGDVATLKSDVAILKTDVAELKSAVARLRAEIFVGRWMLGFVLALQVAILVRLFV
jgi:hypothetical protein